MLAIYEDRQVFVVVPLSLDRRIRSEDIISANKVVNSILAKASAN